MGPLPEARRSSPTLAPAGAYCRCLPPALHDCGVPPLAPRAAAAAEAQAAAAAATMVPSTPRPPNASVAALSTTQADTAATITSLVSQFTTVQNVSGEVARRQATIDAALAQAQAQIADLILL